MTTISMQGTCLCQRVKINAHTVKPHISACHCGMCRQWGGSAFLALQGVCAVEFEGQENISVYNSSEWAERGFCKNCGTHLFYRTKDNTYCTLPAGLFAECEDLELTLQIYIDKKPAYYNYAENTENLTQAQLLAHIEQLAQEKKEA